MVSDWTGWLWMGGKWWRAATGRSIATCARALSKAADQEGVRDPDTVMTREGGAPAGPPPGRLGDRQQRA